MKKRMMNIGSFSYLKLKNKMFMQVAKACMKGKIENSSIFYMTDEGERSNWYDLIGVYFIDEGGYNRALFCPVPILEKSRVGKKLIDSIPDDHFPYGGIVSRNWHDLDMKVVPYDFQPPAYVSKFFKLF
jgi:hypothetical protein